MMNLSLSLSKIALLSSTSMDVVSPFGTRFGCFALENQPQVRHINTFRIATIN